MDDRFLRWCDQTNQQLGRNLCRTSTAISLLGASGRWSRPSVANTFPPARISALRGTTGNLWTACWVDLSSLVAYLDRSLAAFPDWSDACSGSVDDAETDKPQDIRQSCGSAAACGLWNAQWRSSGIAPRSDRLGRSDSGYRPDAVSRRSIRSFRPSLRRSRPLHRHGVGVRRRRARKSSVCKRPVGR